MIMLKSRTLKMFPSTLSKLLSQSYLSCQGSPFPKSVKKNVSILILQLQRCQKQLSMQIISKVLFNHYNVTDHNNIMRVNNVKLVQQLRLNGPYSSLHGWQIYIDSHEFNLSKNVTFQF